MATASDFSTWLDGEMKARDWRQADLIKRTGINSGLLSQILSGQRRPGVSTCRKMCLRYLEIAQADIEVNYRPASPVKNWGL